MLWLSLAIKAYIMYVVASVHNPGITGNGENSADIGYILWLTWVLFVKTSPMGVSKVKSGSIGSIVLQGFMCVV